MTRVRPHNAFVHKDLYSKLPYDGSEPDAEHESRLSKIESDTAPILDDVIVAVRQRTVPQLTVEQELMIKRFHFSMARRTPESQKRVAAVDGDEAFWQAVRRLPEYDTQVGIHEKDRLMAADGMRGLADKILHNVNADFAAADDEHLAREEAKFCADLDLTFVLVAADHTEFVLGGHGITAYFVMPGNGTALVHDGTALPLAPDVLIRLGYPGHHEPLSVLDGDALRLVDAINRETLRLSSFVIGRTQQLVADLLDGHRRTGAPPLMAR